MESLVVHVQDRAGEVGVRGGISTPGEMLCYCDDFLFSESLNHCDCKFRDQLWVVAEGTPADLRIIRVNVHVHHRRMNHVQSGCFHLTGDCLRHAVRHIRVFAGRYSHIRRELNHTAAGVILAGISFLIDEDVERNCR